MKEILEKQAISELTKKVRSIVRDNRREMIFEVGRLLNLIKEEELYKSLEESFKRYLEVHVGISIRMGQYYIRLYNIYGKFDNKFKDWLIENYHTCALFYLTRLIANGGFTESQFKEFARKHTGLTVRELAQEIRKALGEPVVKRNPIKKQLKEARKLIEEKDKRIKELEEEVKKLSESVEFWKDWRAKTVRSYVGLQGAFTRLKRQKEQLETQLLEANKRIAALEQQLQRYKGIVRQIQRTAQNVA